MALFRYFHVVSFPRTPQLAHKLRSLLALPLTKSGFLPFFSGRMFPPTPAPTLRTPINHGGREPLSWEVLQKKTPRARRLCSASPTPPADIDDLFQEIM